LLFSLTGEYGSFYLALDLTHTAHN